MNFKLSLLSGVFALAAMPGFAQDYPSLDPAKFNPPQLVGKGPYGEEPAGPESVKLKPEELEKVRAGKFKVGISMMTMDIDFSKVLVAGMMEALKEGGVEVVGVTDASWKPEKQISDVENLIQLKPDGIISVPADGVATAAAYETVHRAGIKLVLADTVPNGLTYPDEYQAAVGPDQAGIGQVGIALVASRIPQGGTVGIIEFDIDLWAANERAREARRWLAEHRPDIKIKAAGFQNPNLTAQITTDFLTANPDVNGLWATFDTPALGAISGMRELGLDLPVATQDLGTIISGEIAQGKNVVGVGAQRLTDQGRADANAMMKVLIGEKAPPYIAVPALAVTKENLTEGYKVVWNADAPESVIRFCKQTPGCK
ncbi:MULTISPECIES: substrate-binding domain-containing protein [Agrobacterium]|uniref:Substrate-binding domain-containing protein n=1 Tax=Agrobacterium rubi TaxID=28099 RepID=A0AAE7UQV5_9HYPH|nr:MULTISPECIES: substrate-binding domain-containing protein [Agrobacterium]MBN7807841.1 substrate-binding domain-containing protein [Agrobacterium rosae]NTE89801.1 substrate-binding domain-containing protein [Agrobacterium rubi]NTF05349.1 substrate-binding domain-containing protein [Agrobacterium rubi]NTF10496.1 substrate-binding domain-containing protein [Agrobacterium rubi]NTF22890.1 substrate-binding domain-containing protein [Agrobacterium rubi]